MSALSALERVLRLTVLLSAGMLLSFSASAADAVLTALDLVQQGNGRGSAPCAACHGLDGAGNALAGFPRLQGLDAAYLARQLQDIQRGTRNSPVMAPVAASLSPAEISLLAAYYAARRPAPVAPLPTVDEALLLRGQRLAIEGDWSRHLVPCVSCHGPGNGGVGSAFPGLAGQHALYIENQLRAWRSGLRGNDPQQLMLAIAERLHDDEISAVAAWLARQPADPEDQQ